MNLPATSKEVHLVSRPQGEPRQSDFAVVEVTVPAPASGQVLVHNHFLSVDPYMRGSACATPSPMPRRLRWEK